MTQPPDPERITVLDGPTGTLLEAWGVPTDTPAWSAAALWDAPDAVRRAHRAYALAGATAHTAVTFRTRREALGARWREGVRRAVQLAREAVPRRHQVWGSVGPVADCYRPAETPAHTAEAHRELVCALAAEGVDGLLVETMACPREAEEATREAVVTGLPVYTSLTAGPDATLLTPEQVAEAGARCAELGARVVLVNCVGFHRIGPYVDALASAVPRFGVYANAGPKERWGDSHTDYGRAAAGWWARGATVVGACCGCGPRHIEEVVAASHRTHGLRKPVERD